jgi:heterogeneous nuclear ribonucleoprotein A1/A3
VKFSYPKSKIFVGGLDFKLTSDELKDHFSQFGEVVDAIILKDIYTGQSRGFGFVSFSDEHCASKLVHHNPITEINGRRVDIKKAVVKAGGNNLPPNPKASYNQGGGQGGPSQMAPAQG